MAKILSIDNVLEVAGSKRQPFGEVELYFESVTPLWAGGPTGDTITHINSQGLVIPAASLAPSIIGRTRWVLRVLCPHVSGEVSHRKCEPSASHIFGSLGWAGHVGLHVWVDDLPRADDLYLSSSVLNKLKNIFKILSENVKKKDIGLKDERTIKWSDAANALSLAGFRKLRELAGNTETIKTGGVAGILLDRDPSNYPGKAEKLIQAIQDFANDPKTEKFLLLLTVPRYLLYALGAGKRNTIPSPCRAHPGASRSEVADLFCSQPLPPGHKIRVHLTARAPNAPLDKAAAAVALTLTAFGIGKAATRGFGRYRLTGFEGLKGPWEQLLEELREAHKNNACRLAETIGNIIRKLASHNSNVGSPLLPYLPRAKILCNNSAIHPAPYHLQELGRATCIQEIDCTKINNQNARLLCQLSAIGVATLKTTWKVYACKNVRSPGLNLHTWPLGLPRGKLKKQPDKSRGYMLARSKKEGKCYNLKHEKLAPGRLQSPIVLFPAGNGIIAIAAPLTGNLAMLLDPDTYKGKMLLHVGAHIKCPPRAHSVRYIICNEKVESSCGPGAQHCIPQDNGGIIAPRSQPIYPMQCSTDQIAECVEAVAREWLIRLLNLRKSKL